MAETIHKSNRKIYLRVWVQLLIIVIVEIIIALLPISHSLKALFFTITSLMKATLIIAYFMHLRFEKIGLIFSIVLPLILIIALVAALIPEGSSALLMRLGLGYY